MVLLQLYRWKFHTKKLSSELYSIELEFLFTKRQVSFEPPFGGVRDNVRSSSIAHWNARDRLSIPYD